jgi:hypothetical protein
MTPSATNDKLIYGQRTTYQGFPELKAKWKPSNNIKMKHYYWNCITKTKIPIAI